ncbi:MAG: ATP-binding protein [Thermoanaerobaculia bacterium]
MNPPWDFLLVALTAVLGTAVLARKARLHRSRLLALVALIVGLVTGWFYVESAGRRAADDLERLVSAMAPTYAAELERMGHSRIGPTTPPDDPGYLEMIAAEKRWLASNPNVSDIYTFRRTADGRMALLVDSETDYDHDGRFTGERESRTAIGEIYPDVTAEMERAAGGEAISEMTPSGDRWGSWVSSFVPMRTADGSVEAVLGVDYDGGLWTDAIARRRWGALAVLGAVLAVGMTALASVARLRRAAGEAEVRSSELAAARDTALTASRTKSQFLASVSHELRTPLHVFLGMNELLLNSTLDEKQRRLAITAQRSAEGLIGMVDDLLDFAQLEVGKAPMEEALFPLATMLEAVTEGHRIAAEQKKLRFVVESRIDHELEVIGDARRLRQIVRHLLSNAIKFTDAGEICVRALTTAGSGDRVDLAVEVRDTGIGIPEEQRDFVFERFSQIDPSSTRRYGGTGIGLALSRRLAEQLGGAVEFDSAPRNPSGGESSWTVFRLRLPFRVLAGTGEAALRDRPFREA